jgi:flavin reductase (DIM6/NTAB) family NADH-FMN oxidoreductase RutF
MKIELSDSRPSNSIESWPGEFDVFSRYEMLLGIPHALFLITTIKENGKPNACFQSWSSFCGDSGGYFALTPLLKKTHTYDNILRTKEFCINFLSADYFDACYETVFHNEVDTDEIAVGGFTSEAGHAIEVPRIREAFLSLECVFESQMDLSGRGITALVVGKVVWAAIEDDFVNGSKKKYGPDGFMYYLSELKTFPTSEKGIRKVASLNVIREA